ncbi:conserved hypothetical protein [Burkholderia pseudomallei S13]|nr:conserved hypothetical protein [Burkholderia pseudomallei S13]
MCVAAARGRETIILAGTGMPPGAMGEAVPPTVWRRFVRNDGE